MNTFKTVAVVAAGLLALAGCAQPAPPVADTAADEAAVRAINPAWFKAYSAGDAEGVAALYAEDAVLSIPGVAPVHGRAAIRQAYAEDIAAMAAAGLANNSGADARFGVSGDLGWEWNTFTVTDASGATVDTGKYVSVFGRKNGTWQIISDIWNTDTPAAGAAVEAPAN